MNMRKKLLTGLSIALLAAVIAGCGGAKQPAGNPLVSAPAAPEASKEPGAADPAPTTTAPTTAPTTAAPTTPAPTTPPPATGTNPVTAAPAPPPPAPQTLSFTTLSKGGHSGVEERKAELIVDEAKWRSAWQTHAAMQVPTPPAPAVDFQKGAVLAVYMGQKNTGGYAVEVTDVKLVNGKLQVTVKQTVPGPGAITTQALTQPFHLVSIPAVPAGTQVEVNWQ